MIPHTSTWLLATAKSHQTLFCFSFSPLLCCCNGTVYKRNWLLPFAGQRPCVGVCVCVYFCLRCTFCWTSKLNVSPPPQAFYISEGFCLACKVLSSFFAQSASQACKALMWGSKSCHQINSNTEKMLRSINLFVLLGFKFDEVWVWAGSHFSYDGYCFSCWLLLEMLVAAEFLFVMSLRGQKVQHQWK